MIPQESFGFVSDLESSEVVLIPVPWEVTTSYGGGTSEAPECIREASFQLDFFHQDYQKSYNDLIHFEPSDSYVKKLNQKTCSISRKIISNWNKKGPASSKRIQEVNKACEEMISFVYQRAKHVSSLGKCPALVGGDHSVSEGILKWFGEKYQGKFGLLHIDAHFDMRESYQGFKHSHASVMHNVFSQPYPPQTSIQVGIRDFCEEEYRSAQDHEQIHTYFDQDIHQSLFSGTPWIDLCKQIVSQLPSLIYVSLDVDGLDWTCAPSTGTPVPGGLSFNQFLFLLKEIRNQKKKIIGFDVVETSLGLKKDSFSKWNANVSARLIYELCGFVIQK